MTQAGFRGTEGKVKGRGEDREWREVVKGEWLVEE